MPTYVLHISNSTEGEVSIEAANHHEAVNAALNAMTQFACSAFPPPEAVAITVRDATRDDIATLRMSFEINYAPGVTV